MPDEASGMAAMVKVLLHAEGDSGPPLGELGNVRKLRTSPSAPRDGLENACWEVILRCPPEGLEKRLH